MLQINQRHLTATNEVFTKLNNLRRWTDFTTQGKYNELAKQALNCVTAYMLAKFAENAGKSIYYEAFPRIALGRAYAKAYVYFDTPEHKIKEICEIGEIDKGALDKAADQIIAEKTNEEFANFLKGKTLGYYETTIYRAATKIATYVELLEHEKTFYDFTKIREIEKSIDEFKDIPGVTEFANPDSKYFKIIQKISTLRNQNRWATCSYNVDCSVLGHLFDAAIWAYLIALDESSGDETYATKMFFMGIFHDVAEVWTKDIPSPIKDRIDKFRAATEKYELKMLEENLYSQVPDFMKMALKEVMMEDEVNAGYKKTLKDADYLSADSECYRNLLSGTRDLYFADAIINHVPKDVSKTYMQIHKYFEEYAEKIKGE